MSSRGVGRERRTRVDTCEAATSFDARDVTIHYIHPTTLRGEFDRLDYCEGKGTQGTTVTASPF